MGIYIRTAAPDDALAACGVLRRSITECCRQDHRDDQAILDAWLGNKTPQNVAAWLASATNHMLVAERDGELVGVALLTQAGKLSLCYVLPEAQHSGVGKALLAGAEAQARAWGIGVLRLHSTTAGSGFYARNGYINAGKDKTCYGLDCDLFWKKLDAAPGEAGVAGKRFCNCGGA
ncbi:MAG: GNAT family N-acetyltransferase [Pseudomonadota bacterium]|nr:GNAT family N-acetyltransferase [Pseudomonadota bacterium]